MCLKVVNMDHTETSETSENILLILSGVSPKSVFIPVHCGHNVEFVSGLVLYYLILMKNKG